MTLQREMRDLKCLDERWSGHQPVPSLSQCGVMVCATKQQVEHGDEGMRSSIPNRKLKQQLVQEGDAQRKKKWNPFDDEQQTYNRQLQEVLRDRDLLHEESILS